MHQRQRHNPRTPVVTIKDVGNLVESVLLTLDLCPVTFLSCLPHADVALWLNISKARNRTVCTRKKSAVNNNLVTSQKGQRMTVLLVLLNKIPEGNVIARRVFNACKNALCAQASSIFQGSLV